MSVTISKPGYVPVRILVCPTPDVLSDQSADWPFMTTTPFPNLPDELIIALEPALPVYLSALTDDDALIRATAARELGRLPVKGAKRDEVITALTNVLDDQNPQVRESAASAIEKLESAEK
jgi:hypothetical protein